MEMVNRQLILCLHKTNVYRQFPLSFHGSNDFILMFFIMEGEDIIEANLSMHHKVFSFNMVL